MSELTWETQIRVGDDQPAVVDAGTAPDVFDAMANERRRQVVAVLAGESTATDLSTLVDRVANRLPSDRTDPTSRPALRQLRVSLHHQHLPKLAAAGLVEYDAEAETVESTPMTY